MLKAILIRQIILANSQRLELLFFCMQHFGVLMKHFAAESNAHLVVFEPTHKSTTCLLVALLLWAALVSTIKMSPNGVANLAAAPFTEPYSW